MNAHETLGLRPGASRSEVRQAWRRLARRTHPDKGGDPVAFARALAAYQELSGDRRRSQARVVTVVPTPGLGAAAARAWRRWRRRSRPPRVV